MESDRKSGDSYLVTLKKKGKSDEFIAAKMGLKEEEVRERWKAVVEMAKAVPENGLDELQEVCRVLGQQMELLGQSMGLFNSAFRSYEPTELRKIIKECPKDKDLAAYLLTKVIVLRPFSLPSPEKLADALENNPTKK